MAESCPTGVLIRETSVPPGETTVLLPKARSPDSPNEPPPRQEWLTEVRHLVKAAIPVILAYMLQNSLQTLSVVIVGRLSPEALATAAFSYMFAMASAWLIALGGTTALDTLASSSFTGAEDKRDLGILLQRGIVVLTTLYAIVAVLWGFSEHLFRALGQEEYVCVDSAKFLRVLIPGGLGYVWFECMKKFLQAQEIYRPGTYVLLITSPLNALLNYFLIYKAGFGLLGAPLATGISYWCSFLLLVGYATFIRGHECWGGLSPRRAISNLWPFTRLAILGFLHVGTEW